MGLSIDREKVIRDLQDAVNDDWMWQHASYYALAIKKALSLLRETNIRRDGRWKSIPHKKARVCSVCEADEPYKFADDDADVYAYCPFCGAKMEGR